MVAPGTNIQDKRELLFISNRWVNTIYSGYGIIKQRILLEIFRELQPQIEPIRKGKARVSDYNLGKDPIINLDMSKIVSYNNYHIVRQYLAEMSVQPIQLYSDPEYSQPLYQPTPLLNGFDRTDKARMVQLRVKRNIAELLLHIDYGWNKAANKKSAFHYTGFDAYTIREAGCRYVHPLYTMMCSYTQKMFRIKVKDLRLRLDVEEKYKGFDNLHRFVIKPVQQLLKIYGLYGFNYELHKDGGKDIDSITFKVFKNNPATGAHSWKKIKELFEGDNALPFFARMSPEDVEQFNYLLDEDSKYDLVAVYNKMVNVHKQMIRKRENNSAIPKPFAYLWRSIVEKFPPPG